MKEKNRFAAAIKKEFQGWKIFEILLITFSSVLILTLGIIAKDSAIAIIAGITGVIGVILGAKGKISAFVIATINSALYIIIAIQGKLISSLILHSGFYIPMNIIGFGLWFKNRDNEGNVVPKRLSLLGFLTTIILLVIIWVSYTFVLQATTSANNIWMDSLILIGTIVAIILMIFRYVEQWYFWILTNIISLAMWIYILINPQQSGYDSSTAIIFIIMFLAYCINSCYGIINWFKLNRNQSTDYFKKLTKEEYAKLSANQKVKYLFNKYFTKSNNEQN